MIVKEAWGTAVDGVAESDPTQVTTARRVPAVAVSLSCLGSGQNSIFASNISLTSHEGKDYVFLLCCAYAQLCSTATPGTAARQAPLSMGILQAGTLVGFCAFQGICNAGIEPRSPALQVDFLPSEPPGKPHLAHLCVLNLIPEEERNLGVGDEGWDCWEWGGKWQGGFYVWYFELFPSWDFCLHYLLSIYSRLSP